LAFWAQGHFPSFAELSENTQVTKSLHRMVMHGMHDDDGKVPRGQTVQVGANQGGTGTTTIVIPSKRRDHPVASKGQGIFTAGQTEKQQVRKGYIRGKAFSKIIFTKSSAPTMEGGLKRDRLASVMQRKDSDSPFL